MQNTFELSQNTLDTIANTEGEIGALKATNKANSEQVNAAKITAYAELISAIANAGIKLTGNGKNKHFPRQVSKRIREDLALDGGCSDATIKRYVENSAGAFRKLDIPSANCTPSYVVQIFADEGITSEAKLAAFVKDADAASDMEKLAQKLFGKTTVAGNFKASKFDQSDWDEFDNFYREYKAARLAADEAAAAAKAAAEADNNDVDDVIAAFEAA